VTKDKKSKLEQYHFRARLPIFLRSAGIAVLAVVLLIVGIGFYIGSFRQEFRMKGLPTTLSDKAVAVVEGYERKETEDSVLKYFIKADKATTFEDNHQELENVFLEVFVDGDPSVSDKLRARRAIYVPEGESGKDFRIFFAGGVEIDTRDALKITTDQLTYTKAVETAEAEEYVEFARENISGSAIGAIAKIEAKTLELLQDVRINSGPGGSDPRFSDDRVKTAELRAGHAFIDQERGEITLTGNVDSLVVPLKGSSEFDEPTRITAGSGKAFIEDKKLKRIDLLGNAKVDQQPGADGRFTRASAEQITVYVDEGLTGLEMRRSVSIEAATSKSPPSTITADRADYAKAGESFDLSGRVRIETKREGKPTVITSSEARYSQVSGEISLLGGAVINQGTDEIRGDRIDGVLFKDRSLRSADVLGHAVVVQSVPERRSELKARHIAASFSESGNLKIARALGGTELTIQPLNRPEYSQYRLTTASNTEMLFQADGKPSSAKSAGRTKILLTSKDAGPNASDKLLEADSVSTQFKAGTDELESAKANGDALLTIIPKKQVQGKYRTEIRSPGFVCSFFDGNNARSCSGTGKSNAKRFPLGGGSRNVQNLDAERFMAEFDPATQGIAKLEAIGDARFNEADRNGLAERISYTEQDKTVRLRGGEPVFWDETGRVRAAEIDWNIDEQVSAMRGSVSATYYGQSTTRGATPFAKTSTPVFISSDSARLDHKVESALFSGNARAWQDKNYIRGDRLLVEQQQGRFYAEGHVKSLLYEAERTIGGKSLKQPVYAEAGSMVYLSGDRLLRYREAVDIRQGTDRITSGSATVFLDANGELARTVVEKEVTITQPGRRATGDYASYDAKEELVTLRGDPATVRDEEHGSSSGREVTVDLKNNVVVGTGKSSPNSGGRTRSVYKLKDGKLN